MTDGATNAQPAADQAASGIAPVAPAEPGPATVIPPPPADERPELAVGAAFAGGLAIALLLKRMAR